MGRTCGTLRWWWRRCSAARRAPASASAGCLHRQHYCSGQSFGNRAFHLQEPGTREVLSCLTRLTQLAQRGHCLGCKQCGRARGIKPTKPNNCAPASMPPSPVAPAPTTVWISSMNRMMRPLLDVTCHAYQGAECAAGKPADSSLSNAGRRVSCWQITSISAQTCSARCQDTSTS